jgi:recombination protein RecA
LVEEIKMLDAVIKSLNKGLGVGTVIPGNDILPYDKVLSTGSITLDRALGIGGYPLGSIVEIFGQPMAGKTTMALHALVEAQKSGLLGLVIDMENALDPNYATSVGVDLSKLVFSQPDCAEDAFEIIDKMVRSGDVGLVVVDSVGALVTRAELEGDVDKSHVANLARLMSQFLRRMDGIVHRTDCILMFINQLYANINSYGAAETTKGGKALRYYSHTRLEVKTVSQNRNGEEVIGHRMRVKVAKNKHSAPFKLAEFDLVFGKGIDQYGEVLDLSKELGLVQQSGAWFKYNDENIAQGKYNASQYLMENPDVYNKLRGQILGTEAQVEPTEDAPDDSSEGTTEL